MKSKFSLIILILYSLLLIIFAFNVDYIKNINLTIMNSLSCSSPTLLYNIIKYTEIIIFYIGYGICITLACIDNIIKFKYILIYSFLLSVLGVIISVVIKSFITSVDFNAFIISLLCVILGVCIEMGVKIKQIKGGKYEK